MNRKIIQFWNSSEGEKFEKITMESGRYDAIEEIANIFLQKAKYPIYHSLDLGCGTGLFEKALDRKDILGVDISSPLLKLAKSRMDKVVEKSRL
jgi:predicted TPR repeat methyltransferase